MFAKLTRHTLLAAILAVTSCAAPTATPTQPPPLTATASPGIDVLQACDTRLQAQAMRASQTPDWNALDPNACYDLTLDLNPDTHSFTGAARVTFANRTGGDLVDLVFRAYPNAPVIYGGTLGVTAARIDGRAVTPEVFLSDRTGLRLPLDSPLRAGDTALIEFVFEGELPVDFGSNATYGIFNYSSGEPMMTLANWFPMLAVWRDGGWAADTVIGEGDAVVSEVALYRVRVSAPAEWKVVATGSQIDVQPDGESTLREFAGGPVRDFTVMASPAFETIETRIGDVRVVHWGMPGGQRGWSRVLDVAAGSIEVYTDRFGEYPYAELDVVAVPLNGASGVEYPGLIMIDADDYPEAGNPVLDVTVAHEVAHQWWYGVVGNDVLLAPWQDEGLTSFSSFLYFEENEPIVYQGILGFFEQSVSDFKKEKGDEPIAQPLSAFGGRGEAYSAIVYLKGALFFAEVRDRIGDEAFFAALRNYYRNNRYAIASPESLLRAFEEACACQLDELYAEWGVIADQP